jgi:hypothetical protein
MDVVFFSTLASITSVAAVLGGAVWSLAKFPTRKDVSLMIDTESPYTKDKTKIDRMIEDYDSKISSLSSEVKILTMEVVKLSTKLDVYFTGSK